MLEKIIKKMDTLGKPIAYGYFKYFKNKNWFMFVADGGNGGAINLTTGEIDDGEECSFFEGLSIEAALQKALDFVSTEEYLDACKMATTGEYIGVALAGSLSN